MVTTVVTEEQKCGSFLLTGREGIFWVQQGGLHVCVHIKTLSIIVRGICVQYLGPSAPASAPFRPSTTRRAAGPETSAVIA